MLAFKELVREILNREIEEKERLKDTQMQGGKTAGEGEERRKKGEK